MNQDETVHEQLLFLLRGGNAHISFSQAINNFPQEFINTQPPQIPYTAWHLLEHMRIAQWDILEFIRNADFVSPKWPDEYWPRQDEQADEINRAMNEI